jgi:hypothetical protein
VGYPVTSWRRRAFWSLGPERFAVADAVYLMATELTDAWLRRWRPGRWPTPVDEGPFLFELVADSPGRTHTLMRIRGYEAAFRRHNRILAAPDGRRLAQPRLVADPGLSGRHVADVVAEQIRKLAIDRHDHFATGVLTSGH